MKENIRFGIAEPLWERFKKALDQVGASILGAATPKATGTSTHVKTHQDATNPRGGQAPQTIGRTRGGLNTKVTAPVDSKGRALQLFVDSGNQADILCAGRIRIPSGHRLVADKGYDSTAFRDRIWDAGSCPCIPNLKNRKNPVRWHHGYYRFGHRVENFFQRIKRHRRVGRRYEKLSLHFLAFVQLAAILDWLRSPF